jgi:hypothetical protein
MPPLLDGATALRLLREIVAERPQHVYTSPYGNGYCMYVYGGCPSCLIGHVLVRHGWAVAELAERVGPVRGGDPDGGAGLCAFTGEELSPRAMVILEAAQRVQDRGGRWHRALDAAEAAAAQVGVTA